MDVNRYLNDFYLWLEGCVIIVTSLITSLRHFHNLSKEISREVLIHKVT